MMDDEIKRLIDAGEFRRAAVLHVLEMRKLGRAAPRPMQSRPRPQTGNAFGVASLTVNGVAVPIQDCTVSFDPIPQE